MIDLVEVEAIAARLNNAMSLHASDRAVRFPVSPSASRDWMLALRDAISAVRPGKSVRVCCDDPGCENEFAWVEVEA